MFKAKSWCLISLALSVTACGATKTKESSRTAADDRSSLAATGSGNALSSGNTRGGPATDSSTTGSDDVYPTNPPGSSGANTSSDNTASTTADETKAASEATCIPNTPAEIAAFHDAILSIGMSVSGAGIQNVVGPNDPRLKAVSVAALSSIVANIDPHGFDKGTSTVSILATSSRGDFLGKSDPVAMAPNAAPFQISLPFTAQTIANERSSVTIEIAVESRDGNRCHESVRSWTLSVPCQTGCGGDR